MLKLLLLPAIFLTAAGAFAQDIIFKADGTKEQAIIQEIQPLVIIYKRSNLPEGPLFHIEKSKVLLIEYHNGRIEIISPTELDRNVAESGEQLAERQFAASLGKNILSVNVLNFITSNLHAGYERIIHPSVGLKFSANINMGNNYDGWFLFNRIFVAGMDINFYPAGQGKVKPFIGPAIRMGIVRDYTWWWTYKPGYTSVDYRYVGIFINAGVAVSINKKLYAGLQAAIGAARFYSSLDIRPDDKSFLLSDGFVSLNIGYRFNKL